MKQSSWLGFCTAALAVALAFAGCSNNGSNGSTGVEDAGVDSGTVEQVDSGQPDASVDAGFKCRIDDDCEALDTGLRCDYATAECIPAKPCDTDSNCAENLQGAEYCQGIGCRCVQESTKDGGTSVGVCRRRRTVCEECTEDTQCGVGIGFDKPGACKALPGDSSGKKFCLQLKTGPSCECGFIDDGTGYCKPQSNVCTGTGCSQDSECSAGAACNVALCLCEPRCRWDFQAGAAVPACGPNRSCWVDQANLNPTSKLYGAGRCRPECVDDASCTDTGANPYGGPDLVCKSEVTKEGPSTKRCRAEGECMDNFECPEQPAGAPSKGYCDRATRTCETDCRLGSDPITGLSFNDCRQGFACELSGGVPTCVKQTCAQLGGSKSACPGDRQVCCGEDWDGVASTDQTAECGSPLDENKCFLGATGTFCKTCSDDSECAGVQGPSKSPMPSLCWPYQDAATQAVVGICAVSTNNDFTVDSLGVSKAAHGCPQGFSVNEVLLNVNANFDGQNDVDRCKTDADCSVGHTQGKCGVDPARKKPDGSGPKVCLCNDEGTQRCPNASSATPAGFCRSGVGQRACLQSVVCTTRPDLVFGDPAVGGCGVVPTP